MIRLIFFGDDNGESILLQLPGEKYGVVDCYANSPYDIKTNQLCLFLEEYDIRKLLFICWTHPHNDHSRGLLTLLEKYAGKIDYFWIFEGTSYQQLYAYHKSQLECSENIDFSKGNEYLITIFSHIREARKRFKAIRHVSAHKELYRDDDNDVVIEGIAPVDGVVDEYNRFLGKVFDGHIDEDLFKTQRHNMVSAALMISYGNARILLACDTENKTWEILFHEDCYQLGKHSCQIVKVAHHGSGSAFYEPYWNKWSEHNNTFAVITSLQAHGLPEQEVSEKIGTLASKAHILGKDSGRKRRNQGFRRKELINQGLAMLGAEFPSKIERVELCITKDGEVTGPVV
ncbi:MAG: MBL fold metallo-hydrolase [Vulcanimicrobiota bacterium]